MKTCTKCKIEKPFTDFHRDSTKPGLMAYRCKSCVSEINRFRYAADIEANRQRSRDYKSQNPEAVNRSTKSWKAKNSQKVKADGRKWREENKERHKSMVAAWKIENRESVRAINSNRRARAKGADGRFSKSDIDSLLAKQAWLCAICSVKLSADKGNKYHIDHIIPLSRGGSNWPSNLQCLCRSCNLRKGASLPDDVLITGTESNYHANI